MTLPQTAHLEIEQGKTFQYWFSVVYPDGEIADLPADGYSTARMQVRQILDDGTIGSVVLDLSTDNGRIQLERTYDLPEDDPDRQLWTGYLWVGATTTAALQPWGWGVFDLEIEKDGNPDEVVSVLRGTAVLVTEASL